MVERKLDLRVYFGKKYSTLHEVTRASRISPMNLRENVTGPFGFVPHNFIKASIKTLFAKYLLICQYKKIQIHLFEANLFIAYRQSKTF